MLSFDGRLSVGSGCPDWPKNGRHEPMLPVRKLRLSRNLTGVDGSTFYSGDRTRRRVLNLFPAG